MKTQIREWSFPAGLLIAWMTIAAFTVGSLGEMSAAWRARNVPSQRPSTAAAPNA